jgi:hypothetical protein
LVDCGVDEAASWGGFVEAGELDCFDVVGGGVYFALVRGVEGEGEGGERMY